MEDVEGEGRLLVFEREGEGGWGSPNETLEIWVRDVPNWDGNIW
jgi:hypothetical protein